MVFDRPPKTFMGQEIIYKFLRILKRRQFSRLSNSLLSYWPMGNLKQIFHGSFSSYCRDWRLRYFSWIWLRRMPLDLSIRQILVPAMDWCRQTISHYLSQCCHRSLSLKASIGHNELRLTTRKTQISRLWLLNGNPPATNWPLSGPAMHIQYIPRNTHTAPSCSTLPRLCNRP